jgi:GTP-binding protein EngB required for normal cell division
MIEFLAPLEVPTLVVLTKVDKLRSLERSGRWTLSRPTSGWTRTRSCRSPRRTGEGRDLLLESVAALLSEGA